MNAGQGLVGQLVYKSDQRDHEYVDTPFDERDVASILSGVFEINANLVDIRADLRIIRWLLEEDDEEEEEEEGDSGPSA